jgi:poly(3-hydroxybutyrate) depolymerase
VACRAPLTEAVASPPAHPEPATALHAASPIASAEAGGSARLEYERRHQPREQDIDRRWGALTGIVKLLADDPQSKRAWAKASEGERRLAAHSAAERPA